MLRDLWVNPVLRAGGWRVYVYAWRGAGAPRLFEAGPFATKADAKAAVADALPEIAKGWAEARAGVPAGTVAALCRRWRQSPEWAILAPATRKTYHRHLDAIEAAIGALTLQQLARDVGAQACRLLRDHTSQRSLREADALTTTLQALTRFGREVKALPKDCAPAAGLGGLYVAAVVSPMRDEDVRRAIAEARPEVGWAIAVAYEAGFRRTDLCRLAWSWIDEAAGVIRLPTSKGSRKRRVAVTRITPALAAVLTQIPRRAATVLTNAHGRTWKPDSLGQAVDREFCRLGVEGTLHRLRHNAVTRRARQGVPNRTLAAEFGWSEREVETLTAIYVDEAHLAREAYAAANDAATATKDQPSENKA